MEVVIQKSRRKDKKLDAVIDGKKTISFGAAGMSDFTLHKDDDRKQRYIARHQKNENWRDPKTADFIRDSFFGINQPYRLRLMI